MVHDDVTETLNDLLTRAYDAERGYHEAAEKVDDPDLRALFEYNSGLRQSFGTELKELIAERGGEPDKGDSIASKAHRVWIALKALSSSDDNVKVLEECERGEEAAAAEYDEALGKGIFPHDVAEVVASQKQRIEAEIVKIRELLAECASPHARPA